MFKVGYACSQKHFTRVARSTAPNSYKRTDVTTNYYYRNTSLSTHVCVWVIIVGLSETNGAGHERHT